MALEIRGGFGVVPGSWLLARLILKKILRFTVVAEVPFNKSSENWMKVRPCTPNYAAPVVQ